MCRPGPLSLEWVLAKQDMGISNRTWSSITRLAAIVAIVIALVLGINLGRQAAVVYRLRRQEAQLQRAVADEKAKAAALEARKAYVLSDAFVEKWARTVAKLTKPDEVRVVVLSEGQPAPESLGPSLENERSEALKSLPYWHQWWELFFGPLAQQAQHTLD